MPRRNRQATLPRLILAVAAAATAAASSATSSSAAATSSTGTWSPGTRARSSQTFSSSLSTTTTTTTVTAVETTAIPLSYRPRTRRGWGSSPRSRASCRHCSGVGNPEGEACRCFSQHARSTSTFAPLWVAVRGGANARVDGRPIDGHRDGPGPDEQERVEGGGGGEGGDAVGARDEDEALDGSGVRVGAAAGAAGAGGVGGVDGTGEEAEEGEETGVGAQEETTARSDEENDGSADDDDDDDEGTVDANVTQTDDTANRENATTAAKGRPQKSGKARGSSSAAKKEAGVGGEAATGAGAAAAAAAEASSASVVQTLELGKVVPALIKHGAVFFMGNWLSKKLSPAVEGQVRAARVIYTTYLVFSQALCMYLRYLIWKKNDDTEMEVPPPPQLKNILGELGKSGAGAGTGDGESAAGAAGGAAAPSLAPMLDKMMTSKSPVKKYDMNVVQGVRRGQFWASLFMCYTHLRKGMIKPMMLQVTFGMLSLLDSPLFKIYVLGQAAEGDLARPFKKQGLMASLSGPMEGLAAKADEARVAGEAQAAAADTAAGLPEEQAGGGGDGGEAGEEEDVDDDPMPDIETLTDADVDGSSD